MAFRVFVAFEKKTQIGELWRNFCTIGNRGATMSLVSVSLLQLPPPFISLFLTSLLPASGERVTFALWPGKRGGGGKKSCIHLHRLRELEEGEVWRRPTSDIVAG